MRASLRHALWAGLTVGALGAMLVLTPVGAAIESDLGLQWLFSLRGRVEPPEEAVIVSVGEHALARLERKSRDAAQRRCMEATRDRRFGVWPRCLYTALISRLSARGARVIVLDVYFTEAGDSDEDAELARAIKTSGRVLLLQRTSIEYDRSRRVRVESLLSPLPSLAGAALGTGPFPLPKVPARVDQFWAFKAEFDDRPTLPSLALRAYAADASRELLDTFRRLGSALPRDLGAAQTGAASDVAPVEEMRSLRRLVRSRPDLGEQARRALTAVGGNGQARAPSRPARTLLRLYADDDSHYLNLYGPAGTLRIIPADDILAPDREGGLGANALQGKAVFIGLAEQERVDQEDDFHTVFSQDDGLYLSGVEIAATAFLNLLHDRSLRSPNNLLVATLVAAFGIAVALVVYGLPVVLGLAASLAIAVAYAGGVFYGFAGHALWLPTVMPLAVQLPLGVSAGLFLHYRSERAQREKLYKAIRERLPEIAVEALVRGGLAVAPGEVVRGIVLATDIEHFTSLVERTTLQDLAPLLDEYMESIIGAVERHGGYIMDLRGDSVMCVWRDQSTSNEPRLRACLTALDINAAVERFNRKHQRHRMPTRVGLDLGEVRLGDVGGKRRRIYTVLGNAANTASRVENLNKHLETRVLASAAVIDGINDMVTRRVGTYRLLGKSSPTAVYELVGYGTTISAAEKALYRSFARALASFESGAWSAANEQLEAHCAMFKADGAGRFLRDLSREYLKKPPLSPDPWIVEMVEK